MLGLSFSWKKTQLFAETLAPLQSNGKILTDSYESMISPSSFLKLSDCLPHWKFHPKHPSWAAFFKISLAIMNVHCLLWHFFWQWISVDYDSWHAEVGDLFLTTLKTHFCFKIWKKSEWNSPVTVRPAVVLPLETLRDPELSLPQTWHTLAFVLQKATSSMGLTFWYVCQIFLQIY